ncbi:alcohol oxidase [Acephala macrosclerotiorum]|nr:alcohol oxidase [Acephala macrosclerotiorum]
MSSSNSEAFEYDFIVVGGGTADLVVTARLVEDPNIHVLVIEAGADLSEDFRGYLNGRAVKHPQGRALGGPSAVNAEAWVPPSAAVSHTLTLPDPDTATYLGLEWVDEQVEGENGLVQVSFLGMLDHEMTGDPFSGKFVGGYGNPCSVDPASKTRSYFVSAYLSPVRKQGNLKVMTDTPVQCIIFDAAGADHTMRGMEILQDGKFIVITAKKEVILAAGCFQSPKLFELSGIGNSRLLESLGTPVVVDNPNAGENLQDHLMTGISFEVKEVVEARDPMVRQEPDAIQTAMKIFMAMIDSDVKDGKQEQDELIDQNMSPNEGSGALFMILAQANWHGNPPHLENFATLGVIQTYPMSRDSVHITSKDLSEPPKIESTYLSHPLDIEVYGRHIYFFQALAKTEPLTSYLKPDGKRNHPTAFLKSLNDAKEYYKGGVVNERLAVYGTKNLRIVDASVMPLIQRGNCQTSVYAVAERAADLIKLDHGLKV